MRFKGKIAAWWYIFLLLGNAICIWVIFSKQTFWGILGGAIACIMFDVLFVPTIINNSLSRYLSYSRKPQSNDVNCCLSRQTIYYVRRRKRNGVCSRKRRFYKRIIAL